MPPEAPGQTPGAVLSQTMKTLTRTRRSKPDLQELLELQEVYDISFNIVEKSVEGGGTLFYVEVLDPVGSKMSLANRQRNHGFFGSTNRDWTQSSMLRWLKSGNSRLKSTLFHIKVPKFSTIEELRMKLAIRGSGND